MHAHRGVVVTVFLVRASFHPMVAHDFAVERDVLAVLGCFGRAAIVRCHAADPTSVDASVSTGEVSGLESFQTDAAGSRVALPRSFSNP